MPEAGDNAFPKPQALMSKTPSWVMLGFVLGALCVLALPSRKEVPPAAEAPPAPVPVAPEPPRTPPPLSRIEAVFELYGAGAIWSEGTTEVALWDAATERFADFYEVRKLDGKLYFRSLPALTRRIVSRGKPTPDSPLQFTETEEQYREWYDHGRRERPIEQLWQKPPPPPKAPVAAPAVTPPAPPAASPPRIDLAPAVPSPRPSP